ncbi:kinase-like domain-containing protein [Mycena vitilis]|nr:kinase-like domain-containing protein [Mycena vitilis]
MYLKRKELRLSAPAIVVISEPTLLSRTLLADQLQPDKPFILHSVFMMHIFASGLVLYSGSPPSSPPFCLHLFMVWMDAIYRIGGSEAERMWPDVLKLSSEINADLGESGSITTYSFSVLHRAVKTRHQIQKCLSTMSRMKQEVILWSLRCDDNHIANQLQGLFAFHYYDITNISEDARKGQEKNFRQTLSTIPRDHAVSVMNITHAILDGCPIREGILNYEAFSRRAHHLLNLLAAQLQLLPDKLAVTNVIDTSTHPVAHGGYSDIYRGRYQNAEGKEVEVALKVLRNFGHQSDETRHRVFSKFTKEALVWFHLKHSNIVPFLGVDLSTFPNAAMVSPWMARGNVLKYVAENSPVAPYAVQLLNDVISGLNYLHSVNITHGDLCGRNILIDEHGRASLTDFGLTGLIESEPTLRSSTRGGSLRWLPPELISAAPGAFKRTTASDAWAFGCVCGEIWTEGTSPFSRFPTEPAIVMVLSDPQKAAEEQPYQTRPTDGRGTSMPEGLWGLIRRCWSYDPSERPAGNATVEILAAITDEELRGYRHESEVAHILDSPERERTVGGSAFAGMVEHSGGYRSSSSNGPAPTSTMPRGAASGELNRPLSTGTVLADPLQSFTDEVAPSSATDGEQQRQIVRFNDQVPLAIVRFGPLDLGSQTQPDRAILAIFKALRPLVGRDALREPKLIYPHGTRYHILCFRSVLEANNFAMTWAVHGVGLYKDCTAVVVKNSDISLSQ